MGRSQIEHFYYQPQRVLNQGKGSPIHGSVKVGQVSHLHPAEVTVSGFKNRACTPVGSFVHSASHQKHSGTGGAK